MIPHKAMRITYKCFNGPNTTYYVWPDRTGWYWSAVGNDGKEATLEAAMRAARVWIKDGLAGRQRVL